MGRSRSIDLTIVWSYCCSKLFSPKEITWVFLRTFDELEERSYDDG